MSVSRRSGEGEVNSGDVVIQEIVALFQGEVDAGAADRFEVVVAALQQAYILSVVRLVLTISLYGDEMTVLNSVPRLETFGFVVNLTLFPTSAALQLRRERAQLQ